MSYYYILFLLSVWNMMGLFKHDRAILNAQKGEVQLAEELMSSLVTDNPDDGILLYDMGVMAYKKGEFDQSQAYFKSVADIANVSNDLKEKACFNRGNAFVCLQQLHKALLEYEKALRINPENEHAAYNYERVKQMLNSEDQHSNNEKSGNTQSSDQSQSNTNNTQTKNDSNEEKKDQSGNGDELNRPTDSKNTQSDDNTSQEGETKQDSEQNSDNKEQKEQNGNKERADKHKDEKEGQENRVPDQEDDSKYDSKWSKNNELANKPESDQENANLKEGKGDQHNPPSDIHQNSNVPSSYTHNLAKAIDEQKFDEEQEVKIDSWAAHILQKREQEDSMLNKKMIQATVADNSSGAYEKNCW